MRKFSVAVQALRSGDYVSDIQAKAYRLVTSVHVENDVVSIAFSKGDPMTKKVGAALFILDPMDALSMQAAKPAVQPAPAPKPKRKTKAALPMKEAA